MTNTQPNQTIDLDTGYNIITVSAEMFKGKKVFTAYMNNISVRSASLHLPRVLDNFVDCIDCAASSMNEDFLLPDTCERDLRAFVALHTHPN